MEQRMQRHAFRRCNRPHQESPDSPRHHPTQQLGVQVIAQAEADAGGRLGSREGREVRDHRGSLRSERWGWANQAALELSHSCHSTSISPLGTADGGGMRFSRSFGKPSRWNTALR